MRVHSLALLAILWPTTALGQDSTVRIDRGLTDDRPYTLIYPETLTSIDDGSPLSVATLTAANAPFQCDALIQDDATAGWSAESALQSFDRAGTEGPWAADFPGFTISTATTVNFQSGPALYYEGQSNDSPFGIPAKAMHAEAADGGRTYVLECVMDLGIAEDARPLVEFLIANFSTKSDGECCINPAAQ